MRDAGVNLLFLSGNAVCWVTPATARAATAGPNRIMFRGGPYGGDNDYAGDREKEHGPFPERGPDEGCSSAPATSSRSTAAATGSSSKPDHWIFAGTGMKKGDRIPGLVGWEYHGDPADDPRPGGRRRGHGLGRRPDRRSSGPRRSIPAPRATSSSTPRRSSGPRACPRRRATRSPGPTGPARTGPTSGSQRITEEPARSRDPRRSPYRRDVRAR